ncbi:MAG: N-acetylmuramoyl-L-alanine amidase family protein [Lachnospiraceae bacterium]
MRKIMKGFALFALVCSCMIGSGVTALADTKPPKMETVTGLFWDGEKAAWDEVEECRRYKVQLYRDTSLVTTVTVRDTKYNFRPKMTRSGDYRFRVRAMTPDGGHRDSDWSQISEGYAIDEAFANAIEEARKVDSAVNKKTEDGGTYVGPGEIHYPEAIWIEDSAGWWYRNQDGSYPANAWQEIEGKWYFFNGSGYMVTGWVNTNDKWYYCGTDGAMLTNTVTPDGYQVNAEGVWVQ